MNATTWVVKCRACGFHYDPEWLVDGLCEDCRRRAYERNVLAERD